MNAELNIYIGLSFVAGLLFGLFLKVSIKLFLKMHESTYVTLLEKTILDSWDRIRPKAISRYTEKYSYDTLLENQQDIFHDLQEIMESTVDKIFEREE